MRSKTQLCIVDLRPTIVSFKRLLSLRELFNKITIEEIIEAILSIEYYIDYSELVTTRIEDVIADEFEVDVSQIELLVELIVEDVDSQVIANIELGENIYIFKRWVGGTSALLEVSDER